MRFDRKIVHPSIFAATDSVVQNLWSTGSFQGTPEQAKAFAAHQRVWWKTYGPAYGAWALLFVVFFILAVMIKKSTGGPIGTLAMLLAVFGPMVSVAFAYKRNLRELTVEELRVLLPALELTAIQRVYAESLVTVSELKLPTEQYEEVVGQLNRLLDEEARLMSLRDRESFAQSTAPEIEQERDSIRERLTVTTDRVALEALNRSLELCEARLAASYELSHVGERVDAQLEMIAQAIRGIRDSLRRLQMAPTETMPSIDIDAVRQSVDMAQSHSAALERAVREVQSWA